MNVFVESCWNGKEIYQRLTLPNGERERIAHEQWNRIAAIKSLDILEKVYGFSRRNVRFQIR